MAEQEVNGSGEPGEDAEDVASEAGDTAGASGLVSKLKSKQILLPVAASAATALAVAVRKGDIGEKVKQLGGNTAENLGQRGAQGARQQLGGAGGLASTVASKAFGGDHKPATRRLQIQRWTDVAVPIEQAYEAWTNFDEYPKFMHRVVSVKQQGDNKVTWDEKIWFSKRQWEAEIVEQRDNEFIAWKTTRGASHAGVVSFHALEDRLTRVMVTMDFRPTGMIEKMASGLRFVKRAVEADLARFKSHVEFQEAGLEAPQERLEQVKQEESQQKRQDSDDGDRDRGSERSEREQRRAERREKAAV